MTESGGPVNQAGIRYQDQIGALYLGRMLDPTERPRNEQPVEVRVEAPLDVDDFNVRFADGSRRFFQVKLSLSARGSAWSALWKVFYNQIHRSFNTGDRIELILGEPSQLATDLSGITRRHSGSDVTEWQNRLSSAQSKLVSSIQNIIAGSIQDVWNIAINLDVSIMPSNTLMRDLVPLWMPATSVSATRLFRTLTEIAWEGAATRVCFDGASLYDRLRIEAGISVSSPASWGSSQYREALIALGSIEVPGTEFSQPSETEYPWPKCTKYDRERRADFDDDFAGWRDSNTETQVDLRNFPSIDLSAIVIIAGPGFGKTTLVNAIARKSALAGLIPAIVPVTKLSDSNLSIADYLSERLNREFDVQINWRAAVNTGCFVLLLDGLDEVSSDRRTLILERLKVFRASYSNLRWLMTVRDAAALALPEDATVVELNPLQDKDIYSYVSFYRPNEPHIAQRLINKMEAKPELARLARIPIFLALMLVMRQENKSLQRSDLLDTYLETLFRPAAYKATQLDNIETDVLRRISERVAFDALEQDTIGISIRQLERCVRSIDTNYRTDEICEALVRRGVLRKAGLAKLTFPFPVVQEYLASTELLENYCDQIPERLAMIARRPWAQAIQFALERHPAPSSIIEKMLGRKDDVFHTGLRLLGRCLANGMHASNMQWNAIGDRLADIWGNVSWRTNKLVGSIIVDAFSKPLHSAVKLKLRNRHLIHDGADEIIAQLRDTELTLEILENYFDGDVEFFVNLGKVQSEVNRLGTTAFNFYIDMCRRVVGTDKDGSAISSLICAMELGCVDAEVAYSAANDISLPSDVRLAAWVQSQHEFDLATEELIIEAMQTDSYNFLSSAARALASQRVEMTSVIRILQTPRVPKENSMNVMDYIFVDWKELGCVDKLEALLSTEGVSEKTLDQASLYTINAGVLSVFNKLIDRIPVMDTEMIAATLAMFGHLLERSSVERAVSAIEYRSWEAKDRVSIANALTTGLTYRLDMIGLNCGGLEPVPYHPGRTVPFALLKKWIDIDDYEPHDRLRITLDAQNLGVPGVINHLRSAFDLAIKTPYIEECADGALAGRALEVLNAKGNRPTLDELEQLALSETYNFASSIVGVIAKGGGMLEAEVLMRLHENISSSMLRSTILEQLEPLASRLGLRITLSGKKLKSEAI